MTSLLLLNWLGVFTTRILTVITRSGLLHLSLYALKLLLLSYTRKTTSNWPVLLRLLIYKLGKADYMIYIGGGVSKFTGKENRQQLRSLVKTKLTNHWRLKRPDTPLRFVFMNQIYIAAYLTRHRSHAMIDKPYIRYQSFEKANRSSLSFFPVTKCTW